MDEILNRIVWGNRVYDYAMAAGGMLLALIILRLIKKQVLVFVKKLTSRTDNHFDDLLVDLTEKFLLPYLYLFINYSILNILQWPDKAKGIISVAFMFITIYYLIRALNFVIHHSVVIYMQSKEEPPERIKQVDGMLIVVKILTWAMGLVMLADNLGYDITTIVAGLGVGGIAIALAAQNILGDLFNYLVIFFDKPFEIGDFIVTGDNSGVVEKIGIKTTHVRSLDGQQLIMTNTEMAKSVIQNFKRLKRRRITFSVGVVYYTASQKLRKIPPMIEKIIIDQENATYDRVHLKSFGDFSINYEIVYYVESPDYITYMNTHHEISLNIFEQFEKNGIEFAFPTQTLFLNRQEEAGEEKNNNHRLVKDSLS